MIAFLTAIHLMVCFGLIIVVLLQTGKGTGMASVFGGGGGGALMGGKGFGGVLAKATAGLAVLFMLTSITLSLMPRGGGQKSVLGDHEAVLPTEAPAEETVPPQGMPQESAPAQTPSEAPSGN
jgi:preprotein translocase subunit SecG